MNTRDWAFAEMDLRREEDARFPTPPHPWSEEWDEYASMKRDRAMRRKRRGYSRKTAADLVAWAEQQERSAA